LDEFIFESQGNFVIGFPFDKTFTFKDKQVRMEKVDSVVIGGVVYNNVLKVKRARDITSTKDFEFQYWKKDIGELQRSVVFNSQIVSRRNLVRYKVIR